ncbi:TPA: class B sortase [Streptococcus equi subsp. zooepidemicus]|uniref:class B sortase n=1 Tax=Streptococcus equi TaxID=1336 RepID=UPI0005BD0657|nr:class B sortase [Streptococcus equi]KIS04405.1 sortase [Streptococcus equi subsp. zooepidemicus Sz12is]MCD3460499.1 class B sortase [Streptococcus equi subsp. zooepidemicus]HEK9980824.1 class B sortase [Streptococcus equi subsp. zooepidemicus]HEL0005229.1 class B sortase [Streptococcus equi subsp. zooepidemicus]HEL0120009.1 class B sortase [Streptococcus equi subsp. zooepidemicus]
MITLLKLIDWITDKCILLGCLFILLIASLGLYTNYFLYRNASATNYKEYKKSNIDFKRLKKLNPEVIGWLKVKGTNIDYPLVQGKTNFDYINKSVEGDFSLSGSVFLDYRNQSTFNDAYSLIYAHHMAGDVMFGELPKFCENNYFKSHTEARIYLPDGSFKKISFFACVKVDAFDELIFNPTGIDEKEFTSLLAHIKEKSVQYREPKMAGLNQIVSLSTCEDTETDGRILVYGKILSN